jgi:hypothetical protein
MSSPQPERKSVFISYSHKDRVWLERLQVHLKDLERRGLIERWDDTRIQPGSNWREEIRIALGSAKVAVLLISADFIASDFIAESELPQLLAAAENEGVTILPLILNHSLFGEKEELSCFQPVNSPERPLEGLAKVEQEFMLDRQKGDI